MARKTGFLCHELYMWHDTGSAAIFYPAELTVQPGERILEPKRGLRIGQQSRHRGRDRRAIRHYS